MTNFKNTSQFIIHDKAYFKKYVRPSGVLAISQPGGRGPRPIDIMSSPLAGLPGELGYNCVGSDIECLCIAFC